MVRNSFSQNIWVSCFLSESAPFNSADGALENKYYSPQFSSLRLFLSEAGKLVHHMRLNIVHHMRLDVVHHMRLDII